MSVLSMLGVCVVPGPPGRSNMLPSPCYSSEDVISCQLTRSVQCAHQKPITVLRAAAGRVVTGSQDHTVRVRENTLTDVQKRIHTRVYRSPTVCMIIQYKINTRTLKPCSLSLCVRCIVWRTHAVSSRSRATLGESLPST